MLNQYKLNLYVASLHFWVECIHQYDLRKICVVDMVIIEYIILGWVELILKLKCVIYYF